jgi:hypothetical protein
MKYSIRSKGQFTTKTKYALQTLLLGLKELRKVRWIECTCLAYLIAIPLTIANDAYKPLDNTIHYAQAEEVTPPVASSTPIIIEVKIDWTRERINQEIEKKAAEYGKNAETLKKIVACESGYDVDIQSHHILQGKREPSFGLAQIHLPSHPTVTYEQAIDPTFAIDFLAKNYGKVHWSCSKMI